MTEHEKNDHVASLGSQQAGSSAGFVPHPTEVERLSELNAAISELSWRVGLHVDLEVIDVVTGYEARLIDDSEKVIARGDGKTLQGALVALAKVGCVEGVTERSESSAGIPSEAPKPSSFSPPQEPTR